MRNNLKYLRSKKGYSQQEVADILKISREHYNRIEKGRYNPSVSISLALKYILASEDSEEPFMLTVQEKYQLDQRVQKILADHEEWSPDVPLDDYET